MSRKLITIAVLAISFITTGGVACRFAPPAPPDPGERILLVPHFPQPPQSFWCGPATVQMWQGYAWGGNVNSQQQIFDWMRSRYPRDASEFGVAPHVIAAAVTNFAGAFASDELYSLPEQRLALADLSKNIYWGDPVIAIVQAGLHAVVVNGVTWHELETANPQADFVIVQDPLRSPRTLWTVGEWLNNQGTACHANDCYRHIMRLGRRSFALQELAEFDFLGGVYSGPPPPNATGRYKVNGYGQCYWDNSDSGPDQCAPHNPTGRYRWNGSSCIWDPNDSGPDQCVPQPPSGRYKWDGSHCYWEPNDSGPDQCSPLTAGSTGNMWSRLWRAFSTATRARLNFTAAPMNRRSGRTVDGAPHPRSVRASGQSVPGWARRTSVVPRPWGRTRADILANFYAGVRSTKLNEQSGLAQLTPNGIWRVRDILSVSAFDGGQRYYLLHIVNQDGAIVGSAAIDEEGYLLGYEDAEGLNLPRPKTMESAESAVELKLGSAAIRARRYAYSPNDLEVGGSRFAPLARVDRVDGEYYVNSSGTVFREAPHAVGGQRATSRATRQALVRGGFKSYVEVR
jgi:hypothetical protein